MIGLYAKALVYTPKDFIQPIALPEIKLSTSVLPTTKQINAYNSLTGWNQLQTTLIHPNFVQVLSLPMQLRMMVSKPFPFKPLGLVHIANQIEVYNLPNIDNSMHITTHFGQLFSHKRGVVFEVITTARKNDNISIRGTSYYLARITEKNESDTQSLPTFKALSAASGKNQSEVVDIDAFGFSEDCGRRYARVSGDYNPIHLWPITASLFGFRQAIAHGMMTKAKAFSSLYQANPSFFTSPEAAKGYQINCDFMTPIMLPSQLNLRQQQEAKFLTFDVTSIVRNKARSHMKGNISLLD
ncbi:MaoC/PaaZ C-terminal domain-containing protein [Glaciecola sp. 1036]|uniref:MaoC/PaaZ C-terminal domain-containing protein n=1 Tax=Alteromonadaceae TaxID=72275 RepID=UPI003D027C03